MSFFDRLVSQALSNHGELAPLRAVVEKRIAAPSNWTDPAIHKGFIDEKRRFLPPGVVSETVESSTFWRYLTGLLHDECDRILRALQDGNRPNDFRM